MFCQKCGREIKDDEASCPYCGKDVNQNIVKYEGKNETAPITIGDVFKNFFIKSFSADGIAIRKEFIIIFAIHVVQNILLGVIGLNYINTILNIILFIPISTLCVRRLHDTGLSGFFVIFYLVGLLCYMFSFFTSNRYLSISLIVGAIILYGISIFLFLRKSDPNSKWNPKNGYM